MVGPCEWAVFIYAAGNNDLSDVISRQLRELEKNNINNKSHILIQYSALKENSLKYKSGRYIIKGKRAILLEEINNLDMSRDKMLVDFLEWGTRNFRSNKIMCILAGHSIGFMGIMLDYKDNRTNSMDISSFSDSIKRFNLFTNKNIDILVIDTCYMNLIEVLYEVALECSNFIKYIIIPETNPFIDGLNWSKVINPLMGSESYNLSIKDLIKYVIMGVNKKELSRGNLFALKLNKDSFIYIKLLINNYYKLIIKNYNKQDYIRRLLKDDKEHRIIGLIELFESTKECESHTLKEQLFNTLESILIYPKLEYFKLNKWVGLCLYLNSNIDKYPYIKDMYMSLKFNENNNWINILKDNI